MSPSVAIVILNYNGADFLRMFLSSVMATDYDNLAIIVADNGSTDESITYLKDQSFVNWSADLFPSSRNFYIQLPKNYGFADGYNRALRKCPDFDYYVLLNSDVEVPANWLRPIVDLMQTDATIGIAQPFILDYNRRDMFEYSGAAGGWIDVLGYPFCRGRVFETLESETQQFETAQDCFWASGAAMFIRPSLYHNLGGFDSDYFAHMEEIDLCWRVKRAGYKVVACAESKVWHIGGGTLPKVNSRKTFLNFRNSLYSVLKNAPKRKFIWLILARIILDAVAGLRFFLKGEFSNIAAITKAHFSFYRFFGKMIRKRWYYRNLIITHSIPVTPQVRNAGLFRGSIVWSYYLRRRKTFDKLTGK